MRDVPLEATSSSPANTVSTLQHWSWLAGIVVIIIALFALAGWGLDIEVLINTVPGRVSMKPNTALGLIASSTALLLWHRRSHPSASRPRSPYKQVALVLAGGVFVLGGLTLLEYGAGLDFRVNQLIFEGPPDAVDAAIGGRPAPNTAINFMLTGAALWLLLQNRDRAAQSFSVAAFFVALLAITGHLYSVTDFYRVGSVTGMAIPTAIAFLLLALGILFAKGDQGWMRHFSSGYDGGIMMRRMLPLMIVLPTLLGLVVLVIYDTLALLPAGAFALRSVLSITLFTVVIWWNGRSLNRIDAQREAVQRRFTDELEAQVAARTAELQTANQALREENTRRTEAEAHLRESETRMRRAITLAPFPIVMHAEDGQILAISRTLTEITGYTAKDIPTIADWTERAYGERQAIAQSVIDQLYHIDDRVHDGEFAVQTLAGEIRTWDFSSAPLGQMADGRRLVISMASDITRRKRIETELAASRAQLQQQLAEIESIYRSAPIGLNVLDRDLRFVRINQRLAEINGFSVEAHIGRTVRELLPDLADTAEAMLRPIFETGQPLLNVEIQGGTPAQPGVKRVWCESFLPLKEGDRVVGINTVCEEITERRQNEEALAERAAQQAEVAHIGQQALASHDLDAFFETVAVRMAQVLKVEYCKILELQPEAEGLRLRAGVGWREGLVGQAVIGYGKDSQAGYTLLSHEPVVVEDLSTDNRFNGPPLLMEHGVVSGMSIIIGDVDQPFGVIGVHTQTKRQFSQNDVNFLQAIANILAESIANYQSEQAIREINASLELRVKERTQQLLEVNQELESFAYSVSHDLRAPLRAIEGLARIFQEDYRDRLDATGQEYTQILIDSAGQMDGLIRDLLAYSRLGRREVQLSPVDLDVVVKQVWRELVPTFAEPQPEITITEPLPRVLAQRTVLRQVLVNLMNNAVKFVEPGTIPTMRIWATEQDDWVQVWVEDNGVGIDPRHQERIFRPFERLFGIEQYPGTGIGLAIVQRGITRMGGQVGVESTVGEGSRFWFRLHPA